MSELEERIREILQLPRGEQVAATRVFLQGLPTAAVREEWNTAFGPGSLFEAWTRTNVASGVYAANARGLRPMLDERADWTILEVGAGNGELWQRLLQPSDRGTLIACDPSVDALAELGKRLPPGVKLDARIGRVEDLLPLPAVDAVVCSLTLHHCAGRSAEERAHHGLGGIGKLEVLLAFADAIRARQGRLFLSEADIHCEVDLASGSEILKERLFDSYVRRCARSILADLEGQPHGDLADRWRHIARHWCLEQVRMADLPVADRDVYELDVGRWLELLGHAGLQIESHRFTDVWCLFHQYVARAA